MSAHGRDPDVNVVGGELLPCSNAPLTGFFRDGCCATGPEDLGSHTAEYSAEVPSHSVVMVKITK